MDHQSLIRTLRARRDDPLDVVDRFCEEICDQYEITEIESHPNRSKVAAVRKADLDDFRQRLADADHSFPSDGYDQIAAALPEGYRPQKVVMELVDDRLKLAIVRRKTPGEAAVSYRTLDIDAWADEGSRIDCLGPLLAMLRAVS
jgi:hypothetical protein